MAQIEDFLESKGVRPTAMRLLVFKYLADRQAAATLSDVEASFSKAERTTLYRTLKTFEENSIVHQIDDGTGISRYALCEEGCNCDLERHLHLHFHCNKCDETVCLTDYKIPPLNLPKGFIANDANMVLKGICDKCSQN